MRLVSFMPPGQGRGPALGLVIDTIIVGAQSAWTALKGEPPPAFLGSLGACLDTEGQALDALGELGESLSSKGISPEILSIPEEDATLLAPLPRPGSLRDCMAFPEHLLQATRGGADMLYPPAGSIDRALAKVFGRGFLSLPKAFFEFPAYYKGNPRSVVGHGATIVPPSYTQYFDYELEFGIFIGKGGRNIPEGRAHEHIAGFTIFNDFSARDIQLKEMSLRLGPAKGKDFDTGNAMGPYLVTPDSLGDPYALKMEARVDGEVWTQNTSGGMAFSFEEIIAYVSRSETLYPGDFIGGGTVGGGCGLEHGRWLQGGQTIECEVDGLGVLRNTIAAASEEATS